MEVSRRKILDRAPDGAIINYCRVDAMNMFEPLRVGNLTLKNRIMLPGLNPCYEGDDGSLSADTVRFFEDIARGGTAYLVLGEIYPVRTNKTSPKIISDAQIPSFNKLCNAIHKHGALAGGQLYYPDRDIEKLSPGDLGRIRKDFIRGAGRWVRAGFDAIQLSGEYFLGSLCSASLNRRQDLYGGSLENRVRFIAELIREIKSRYPDVLLDFKLTVTDIPGWKGFTLKEAQSAAKMMEAAGLDLVQAAYSHPSHGETVPAMGIKPYACFAGIAASVKKAVGIPVSSAGRIIDARTAEIILGAGLADIIAIGRGLIADPHWVRKTERNEPVRHCISCNKCLDKAANNERLSCCLHRGRGTYGKAAKPGHIIIAGAGPAGLEAARIAASRGHRVSLYEKSYKIGGQVLLASVPPRKGEMLRFIDFLGSEMIRLDVDIRLGKEIWEEDIIREKPDRCIIAVGAENAFVPVEGSHLPHVLDSWKVLAGTAQAAGTCAVIGGSFVGIEVAEYLCSLGNKVFIVEMENAVGIGQSPSIWPAMLETYKRFGVQFLTSHRLKKIVQDGITCGTPDGDVFIPCRSVVMATSGKPVEFPVRGIKKAGIRVDKIGDCKTVANIEAAVHAAHALLK